MTSRLAASPSLFHCLSLRALDGLRLKLAVLAIPQVEQLWRLVVDSESSEPDLVVIKSAAPGGMLIWADLYDSSQVSLVPEHGSLQPTKFTIVPVSGA